MAKRKTKEQREAEQKAALHQRIYDVCCGASGYVVVEDDFWLDSEILSRVVPALESMFGNETDENGLERKYLFRPHNLNHFGQVEDITDFLFDHGVRA